MKRSIDLRFIRELSFIHGIWLKFLLRLISEYVRYSLKQGYSKPRAK